jgi:hypothetical protein
MNNATLTDFKRATGSAIEVQARTAHYAARTPAFYLVRLLLASALGGLIWLDSPYLAAAISVTGILYSGWHSLRLALFAARYAEDFVIELSERERLAASLAWSWLSYLRCVNDLRFIGLNVGMTAMPALVFIWTGQSTTQRGMHFVVIDALALSVILVGLSRSGTLVSPLLKKLHVEKKAGSQ